MNFNLSHDMMVECMQYSASFRALVADMLLDNSPDHKQIKSDIDALMSQNRGNKIAAIKALRAYADTPEKITALRIAYPDRGIDVYSDPAASPNHIAISLSSAKKFVEYYIP